METTKTETMKCRCKHEFQDERYGKGNRVFTIGAKGDRRCTVCGAVQQPAQKAAK